MAAAVLTAPILFAFWLVVLPSVLSGAFDVLIPLRMDDLGASGIAVGAAFFVAAGDRGVHGAGDRPRLGSPRADDPDPGRPARGPIAALLLPLPESRRPARGRAWWSWSWR